MPVNVPAACAILHARYDEVLAALNGLPVAGSVSDQGRTLSSSAAELSQQLKTIAETASALGCPIGPIGEPGAFVTRARA